MHIVPLDSEEDWARIASLHLEYTRFICRDICRAFGHDFDGTELHEASFGTGTKTRPPAGRSFAGFDETGRACGMIMMRQAGENRFEVKRLFVRPEGQGHGLGRRLVQAVIDEARQRRATEILLDTTSNLTTAISLYERMGFTHCQPYPESDVAGMPDLVPHGIYMRLALD